MTEQGLDPKYRNRLTRYLHTGNELPKYFPGCWSSHKYFEINKLQSINEAFANCTNNIEVVNVILQAYKDGWYTRFDTIAFALTKCLLHGSPAVKEATYKAATEICKTPEQLLTFNKYTRRLKTGNGRGWCNSVKQWYRSKEPLELAKEITRIRSRHGRSHKTLLRKSHFKIPPNDHARDAVVKYAIYGLRRAKQLIGEVEGTSEVFEYIQKVEDMRHCEAFAAAAQLVRDNNFTLDHVPGHLLTSQEVWDAIIPQFTLEQILYNIQRIHNMGYLTADSTTTGALVSMLNDPRIIKNSQVTPLEVYITLCNYKNKTRPVKFQKAKVAAEKEQRRRLRQVFNNTTKQFEWKDNKRHPKEKKHIGIDQSPNPLILSTLKSLIDQTWLLTPPTNARYMITMDMRHHMFKGRHFCKNYVVPKKGKKIVSKPSPGAGGDADTERKSKKRQLAECFYNKHVTPGNAAIILALQILKREKNVKLAVFTEEGVQIMNINRNATIEVAEQKLREAEFGRVQMDAPIDWAIKKKHKVDVFINMVDRPTRYMELDLKDRGGRGPGGRFGGPPKASKEVADRCPVRALERYRTTVGVRDAKLIVMSLASHRVGTTDGTHEGVLDIIGVDEYVPKVMDAFVRGAFK